MNKGESEAPESTLLPFLPESESTRSPKLSESLQLYGTVQSWSLEWNMWVAQGNNGFLQYGIIAAWAACDLIFIQSSHSSPYF